MSGVINFSDKLSEAIARKRMEIAEENKRFPNLRLYLGVNLRHEMHEAFPYRNWRYQVAEDGGFKTFDDCRIYWVLEDNHLAIVEEPE